MARISYVSVFAFMAALAAPTGVARSADARLEMTMPVACSADEATVTIEQASPLILNAAVNQSCNTTHALNVTYQPQNLTNPAGLVITLAGNGPNITAPGSASFTNLPVTNSVQNLRITYNGPPAECATIAQTVHVSLSY